MKPEIKTSPPTPASVYIQPGDHVRVTKGIFKDREYIVGDTIGVRTVEPGKEMAINRDVLEVIGDSPSLEEINQALYAALTLMADHFLLGDTGLPIEDFDKEWKNPHFIELGKYVREVLGKHGPNKEKENAG